MKQQALQLKEELNISNTEPTVDNNIEKEKNLEAEFGKFKKQDYECSHDFEM